MWEYMKMLEYPVNIKNPDPKMAQLIISQYGGPDGEMGAATRYLTQRYAMPYREVGGLFTDIGREAPEMFRRACKAFSEANAFLATVCPLDSCRPVDSLCCPQPYSSI